MSNPTLTKRSQRICWPPPPRLHAVARALAACCGVLAATGSWAQAQAEPSGPTQPTAPPALPPLHLRLDSTWSALPRGAAGQALPAWIRAQRVDMTPGEEVKASGEVEFRRGNLALTADQISYRTEDGGDASLRASGHVRITQNGAVYSGPELQIRLRDFQGWFENPRFEFPNLGAGGEAKRVEFLGNNQLKALDARYTSCLRDDSTTPAWQIVARSVKLDLDNNEGVAEGAVLRFLGMPILAAPTLSFPVSDERKSGWLPPSFDLDNRSGVAVSVPYYWNIAPNRDATVTPRILARRGFGADLEFRYLQAAGHEGLIGLDAMPYDRLAERTRSALRVEHRSEWKSSEGWLAGSELNVKGLRVSDDDWWKDFPRGTSSATPRLLGQSASFERPIDGAWMTGLAYARLAHWQVLQSADAIVSPYQRSPQLGVRLGNTTDLGLSWSLETELNRFTLARREAGDALLRPEGARWHATGELTRPITGPGWWIRPGVSLHAVAYDTTGRPSASFVVPTLSLDAGAVFERQTVFLGRPLRQILEPRAHFVRTPYREQNLLPNYDSAAKDFNVTSIFSDNAWSGVDRVSDSHQLTLGATTRLVRDSDGAELFRLALVQRMLLSPERVTPNDLQANEISSEPLIRKLSDVLVLGSTQVVPRWTLSGTVRYNADTQRAIRSVLSARYNASDFRAFSAAYRFTRGQAEQFDFGWQWPLTGVVRANDMASSSPCGGRLYGVGRVNYSMRDSRITDSLLGLEYDAGCWIGRVVAERVSTGRSEATTRLMLQLELVGLSRLGSNPLKRLKENIPGYRLLREDRSDAPSMRPSHD